MILTCPSCGTQYVVEDGAIPASGRQVRCKACQHSWREFPPTADKALELDRELPQQETEAPAAEAVDEPREHFASYEPGIEAAPGTSVEVDEPIDDYERDEPLAEAPASSPIPPEAEATGLAEASPSHRLEWVEEDEDFSPFAPREPERKSRSRILVVAITFLLIAAVVAGLWFFAPPELKARPRSS
jgi:predicted Zn finger-like uncharacterized protein